MGFCNIVVYTVYVNNLKGPQSIINMRLHSTELLFLDFRDTASQQQQQRQQEYPKPATAASKATVDEI
jgi:hypothetical protein